MMKKPWKPLVDHGTHPGSDLSAAAE